MKDLPIRTIIAVLLLGLLALVLYFGGWVQAAVLGVLSSFAVFEMLKMYEKRGIHPFVVPHMILAFFMFAVLYAWGAVYVAALAFLAFLAVMIERILNKKRNNSDLTAAFSIFVYPLSLLLCFGLLGFENDDTSRIALLCCFAGPAMADNTAYMVGSLIGKHKLCPVISPNKTVEGAVSGLIGGALGGVIVYFVQKLWGIDIPLITLIIICFIGGAIGQFGDLLASSFNRYADIKDYGHIFPGHGGIMDRLDSAMIAAPFVTLVFKLFINK